MIDYGLPLLYATFLWWFSTGLILFAIGLPRRTHVWTLAAASVFAVFGLAGFALSLGDVTVTGAYVAFTSAIVVWGWHEVAFLTGYVTGTRRAPATVGAGGWLRFREAFATIVHHELAILATGLGLVWLAWGAPNQVGVWTFLVLWVMRVSAKLNVFWGVPNINEEFLPRQLAFLTTYFRKGPTNAFFPFAVSLSTIVAAALLVHAVVLEPGPVTTAGLMLVGALLALAIVEHWFMVLPLRDATLWRWALRTAPMVIPPAAEDANALQFWRSDLAGAYDRRGLERLLHDLTRGAFGEVAELRGMVRACSGWVRFDLVGGRISLAACTPPTVDQPWVEAQGRAFDAPGLAAAFDACLARRAA